MPCDVLVVDDNVDAAETLAAVLEMEGYTVGIGFNGAQALSLIDELRPRVAVLDIGMPQIDGYEVAKRVRAQYGAGIVLIALTGWGQASDRERALAAGFDHHIVKPVDIKRLAVILEQPRMPAAS
jgi:CheY-like chemotaxis protein